MAYDKVVDSSALDASLTTIADAIREKTNSTDKLTLNSMATAISGIKISGTRTWYEGTTEPSSSLGSDGDLYIQTTGS